MKLVDRLRGIFHEVGVHAIKTATVTIALNKDRFGGLFLVRPAQRLCPRHAHCLMHSNVDSGSPGCRERLVRTCDTLALHTQTGSRARSGRASASFLSSDQWTYAMNDTTDDSTHVTGHAKQASGVNQPERTLWVSRPSQIVNLHIYVLAVIATTLIGVFLPLPWVYAGLVPPAIALVYGMATYFTRYELTTERLRRISGLTTRVGEEVELYRVEDTRPIAPMTYRLIGLGNVIVISSDHSCPKLPLIAIKNHEAIRNLIRDNVEVIRHAKGVRVVE